MAKGKNTLSWQKQENTIYFNYGKRQKHILVAKTRKTIYFKLWQKAKTHSRGKNKKILVIYFNYSMADIYKAKTHSYEQMDPFPRGTLLNTWQKQKIFYLSRNKAKTHSYEQMDPFPRGTLLNTWQKQKIFYLSRNKAKTLL